MSKGYAKRYFTAIGQSDRERKVSLEIRRRQLSHNWPYWATDAYWWGWTWNGYGTRK